MYMTQIRRMEGKGRKHDDEDNGEGFVIKGLHKHNVPRYWKALDTKRKRQESEDAKGYKQGHNASENEHEGSNAS